MTGPFVRLNDGPAGSIVPLGAAVGMGEIGQVGGAFGGIVLGPLVAIGLGHALARADLTTS